MLNDYAQRIEKLVVELLTKSKGVVFGLFKGLFDDNAQGCVPPKAQILAKYTALGQVQGIRIGWAPPAIFLSGILPFSVGETPGLKRPEQG